MRKRLKKLLFFQLFVTVLVTISALPAFAGNDAADTLYIQLPHEPVTLDSASAEDGVSFRVLSVLHRGLMRYDRAGKLRNALAEHVEFDQQKQAYRIRLNKEARWSDGVPVVADQFVYGMKRALDPKRLSKMADLFYFVRGAEDYRNGKSVDFEQVGIRALSKHELEFRLHNGFGVFLHVLALPVALPFRQDLEERMREKKDVPTTGPYSLKEWKHDVQIACTANSNSDEKPAFRNIVFQVISDDATARSLFEKGRLDVITKVNPLEIREWKRKGALVELPYAGIYYFAFDLRSGAWSERVRKSIAKTINKDAIVKTVDAADSVARDWLHPIMAPSAGCCRVKEGDRTKGTSVLKGEMPKKVRLAYDSNSRNQLIAEQVQKDLTQNLKIEVELVSRDWKTHLASLASGGFNDGKVPVMYRMGWLAPLLDLYGNFLIFHSQSLHNYSGWKSAKMDALIDELGNLRSSAKDENRRKQITRKLLGEIQKAGVFAPIFHYNQQFVIGPKAKGFSANPLGQIFFE